MNDADIEMAHLEKLGNYASKLRKQGICTHGWLQGPPKGTTHSSLTPSGKTRCLHCGKEFATMEAALDEHYRIMQDA